MSVNLKIEDFREFNDEDWFGWGGANDKEGTPLIYEGDKLPYTIVVCADAVGVYFYDSPEDINGMMKQVASFEVGKKTVEVIRWPDMENDDIEDLELLGFDFI
jgi:hypothetical protein